MKVLKSTIDGLDASPWWFTPLMTFAGIVFGGILKDCTASGLLGDRDLVRKLRYFLADVDGNKEANRHELLFGDGCLKCEKDSG